MKRKFAAVLSMIVAAVLVMSPIAHASQLLLDVETFAGIGSHGSDDGEMAQFNMPLGIIEVEGRIMVADTFNSMLRAVDPNGSVESLSRIFPLRDEIGFPFGGHIDRVKIEALFNHPTDFARGRNDWIFVADSQNNAIRVIVEGSVYTMAGGFGEGFADGDRQAVRFNRPFAVAVSPRGLIYVADTGNHVIRQIDLEGNVTTVAGVPGVYGYQNGAQEEAMFDSPMGLVFDQAGRLLVADTGNHVIRILYEGQVSTFAGTRQVLPGDGQGYWLDDPIGGFLDGDVELARFNRPMGMAVSGDTVFVADSGNHALRVISYHQVFTVSGTGLPGHVDGDLASAMFYMPGGLYISGDALFVADSGNNVIRRVSLNAVFDLMP